MTKRELERLYWYQTRLRDQTVTRDKEMQYITVEGLMCQGQATTMNTYAHKNRAPQMGQWEAKANRIEGRNNIQQERLETSTLSSQ